MKEGGGPDGNICGYAEKCGGKNGKGQAGGRYMVKGLGFIWSCGGVVSEGVVVVESQKRLCFESEVTVEKDWPHLAHLICIRQSACIRLCLQRLENWV